MAAKNKAVPAWAMRLMDFTAHSSLGMASDDGGVSVGIAHASGDETGVIRPEGRFVIDGTEEGGSDAAVIAVPTWKTVRPAAGAMLIRVDTPAGGRLIDIGLTSRRGEPASKSKARNIPVILGMYEIKGWPDAVDWMLRIMDVSLLGRMIAGCSNTARKGPLPMLLTFRSAGGGPVPGAEGYAAIINGGNGRTLDPLSFLKIRGPFEEAVGESWASVWNGRCRLRDPQGAMGDGRRVAGIVKAVKKARREDPGLDDERACMLMRRMMNGTCSSGLILISLLDGRRAGFVASMLLADDECLTLWNPLKFADGGLYVDRMLVAEREAVMESAGMMADITSWIDVSMKAAETGGSVGVGRLTLLAGRAAETVGIILSALPPQEREDGRIIKADISRMAMLMDGSEKEGAEALAAWMRHGGRCPDFIWRMMTHGVFGPDTDIAGLLRLLRVVAHETGRGGDVGRIMRAAVQSLSLSGLCDVTWDVILQSWMDGPGRELPLGFLVEDLRARIPCLNA